MESTGRVDIYASKLDQSKNNDSIAIQRPNMVNLSPIFIL